MKGREGGQNFKKIDDVFYEWPIVAGRPTAHQNAEG